MVGEHGAGKSSLAMILGGLLKPQSGIIRFDGQAYRSLTLNTAYQIGIHIVHQHVLSLNERFSVAENLFLTRGPFFENLKWKYEAVKTAQLFLSEHDIDLNPQTLVDKLNLSDRILVDILKHIYVRPKLLILDEALEKLSSASFKNVVPMLMRLKEAGTSILLITHRIDDIYNLADRVSVLKNGEVLVTDDVRNIDKLNLIKIAYMQIADGHVEDLNREFYQLLKYNEAILRNLPVNLIVTDNENRIKLVNEYCKQYFRLEKTSYQNVPVEQLMSSSNEDVKNLIHNTSSFIEEYVFYQVPITFNQTNIISNIKIFPIYDGTFLIGNIMIIEDMSEFDQLQKQVMLSEKLASVGLLAAGVAHEINNPLGIIYNYLSYIKYRFPDQHLHEAIDNVHEEISSISTIVSNLHTFSDNKQLTIEEIHVNELIRSILNLIQHSAKYKHITIHFEPYQEEIGITANKSEIKQVILNLLKNSFEAMSSGGEIFIKTLPVIQDEDKVVHIIFQDTGPGVNDENPDNIFLPFYSTKKGTESNLGLGLSVSYGIIKKYHGTISVKNIKHSGCQFVISLPQSQSLKSCHA